MKQKIFMINHGNYSCINDELAKRDAKVAAIYSCHNGSSEAYVVIEYADERERNASDNEKRFLDDIVTDANELLGE